MHGKVNKDNLHLIIIHAAGILPLYHSIRLSQASDACMAATSACMHGWQAGLHASSPRIIRTYVHKPLMEGQRKLLKVWRAT